MALHRFMGLFDRFAKAAVKVGYLRLILPSGYELRWAGPSTQVAEGF